MSSGKGNPEYRQDRERSFRLAQLEAVAKIPGVQLLSFQRVFGLEQLGEINDRFAVTDIGGKMSDFMDIAAALANTRSGHRSGHLACASGRGAWSSRLGCACVCSGLAMVGGAV